MNRLDFPTFGLPAIATRAPSRISRPRLASQSSAPILSFDRAQRRAGFAGLDEVVTLVWKIERRLELRRQIEQFGVDLRDAVGQRPFQLIERGARLQGSDGVDQIGDRLGLHEIDAAVQKCAKRELARLGKPRPQRHRLLDDLPQHDGASVSADFDDVLAGVGMRGREVGRDDLVAVRARERRIARLQGRVESQQPAAQLRQPRGR